MEVVSAANDRSYFLRFHQSNQTKIFSISAAGVIFNMLLATLPVSPLTLWSSPHQPAGQLGHPPGLRRVSLLLVKLAE